MDLSNHTGVNYFTCACTTLDVICRRDCDVCMSGTVNLSDHTGMNYFTCACTTLDVICRRNCDVCMSGTVNVSNHTGVNYFTRTIETTISAVAAVMLCAGLRL